METRAIRDLTVLLPGDDPDDLPQLDGLPRDDGAISGRRITGQALIRARITETIGCCLRGVTISEDQLPGITEGLTRELSLEIK